jgi:hypothetical protein
VYCLLDAWDAENPQTNRKYIFLLVTICQRSFLFTIYISECRETWTRNYGNAIRFRTASLSYVCVGTACTVSSIHSSSSSSSSRAAVYWVTSNEIQISRQTPWSRMLIEKDPRHAPCHPKHRPTDLHGVLSVVSLRVRMYVGACAIKRNA